MGNDFFQNPRTEEIRDKKSVAKLLARNTFYNLSTQTFLVVIAIVCLPPIVRGLSKDGFGILSLVWALVGYFSLLDFGISRAITKFLPEALVTQDSVQVRKYFWTAFSITLMIGLFSGSIIIALGPWLVHDVFKVGSSLSNEANAALILSAFCVPFVLVFGTIKGFLMALQRFEIVNLFQGVMGILQWCGTVSLIWMGLGLREILFLTVGLRVIVTLSACIVMWKYWPSLFDRIYILEIITLKKLFSFGGWVTISQIISPLFLYLDRVLIGAYLSLSAVAYYTVPQEALFRILIIPTSLTTTLFPALSEALAISGKQNTVNIIYVRSIKYLFVVMIPILFLIVVFSSDILRIWIGNDFAIESKSVLQLLAIGIFFNSLAQIPTTVLHAFSRPDITAKFHIIEIPLMLLLCVVLIPRFGIIGAALTWTIRVLVDTFLLFFMSNKYIPLLSFRNEFRENCKRIVLPIVLLATFSVSQLLIQDLFLRALLLILNTILYATVIWMHSFDNSDRKFFLNLLSKAS